MRIRFHHTKKWSRFVHITLVVLIALLIAEIFFAHELENIVPPQFLGIIDFMLTSVLFLDLVLWYSEARNKYNFIRRNWLKVVAVFPFMPVFMFAQFLRLEQFFVFAFSSEIIADIVVIEKLLRFEKGIKVVSKAGEFLKEMGGA